MDASHACGLPMRAKRPIHERVYLKASLNLKVYRPRLCVYGRHRVYTVCTCIYTLAWVKGDIPTCASVCIYGEPRREGPGAGRGTKLSAENYKERNRTQS